MIKFILATNLILISITASAQLKKIETERPGKTNTPATVPNKWMQFETGLLMQTEKINPPKRDLYIQHPYLLTKYGVGNRAEIRLITELVTIKEINVNGNTIRTGINSVQLGGKLNFLKEKGIRPKTALIAHYDFRRLRTLYRGDSIDGANFRFAMQHTLSKTISLGYNIGMEWRRFGSPPDYIYTFSPSFNISEKLIAYIELFGFIWKNQNPENSIDGGFAYYITDNFKIDASSGFGLNKKAPDNFYSIGASFRFNFAK